MKIAFAENFFIVKNFIVATLVVNLLMLGTICCGNVDIPDTLMYNALINGRDSFESIVEIIRISRGITQEGGVEMGVKHEPQSLHGRTL